MIDPSLGKALADLGGLALFLLAVVAAFVTLLRGGDKSFGWVPGWMYRQEREARLASEAREAKLAAAVEKMAKEHERDRRPRQPAPRAVDAP